jgi:hypothetical protein
MTETPHGGFSGLVTFAWGKLRERLGANRFGSPPCHGRPQGDRASAAGGPNFFCQPQIGSSGREGPVSYQPLCWYAAPRRPAQAEAHCGRACRFRSARRPSVRRERYCRAVGPGRLPRESDVARGQQRSNREKKKPKADKNKVKAAPAASSPFASQRFPGNHPRGKGGKASS